MGTNEPLKVDIRNMGPDLVGNTKTFITRDTELEAARSRTFLKRGTNFYSNLLNLGTNNPKSPVEMGKKFIGLCFKRAKMKVKDSFSASFVRVSTLKYHAYDTTKV